MTRWGGGAGGKTASMKTLGLLVLMAKAGLFLPLETSGKEPTARLPWFDRVLADLGDSQDLTQNLSTFSGHVTRVKRITASVSPKSLVLLDEVLAFMLHIEWPLPLNPALAVTSDLIDWKKALSFHLWQYSSQIHNLIHMHSCTCAFVLNRAVA